LEKQQQGAKKY
jgi:hypothetical protein